MDLHDCGEFTLRRHRCGRRLQGSGIFPRLRKAIWDSCLAECGDSAGRAIVGLPLRVAAGIPIMAVPTLRDCMRYAGIPIMAVPTLRDCMR